MIDINFIVKLYCAQRDFWTVFFCTLQPKRVIFWLNEILFRIFKAESAFYEVVICISAL